ncbi:MAG TPA: hypothetical protein DCP36_03150, partial [Sporomusaceae bacterium]|nr:hypothetical protein [Sporomusaceae bacterium]
MPEIPEIETVCTHLRDSVLNSSITGITINRAKCLNIASEPFISLVSGQSISAVGRRAKIILLRLSNQHTITIHFMLEGYVQLLKSDDPDLSHASVALSLSTDKTLAFFKINLGYIHLFPTTDWRTTDDVSNIGPEPLSEDFTASHFLALLRTRKGMIKPLLMDQKLIAGIGNVYSNEVLFYSRILPTRKVKEMTDEELSHIYHCLRSILNQAIYRGGVYDRKYSQN